MKYAQYVIIAILAVSFGVAGTPGNSITAKQWEKAKANYISQLTHPNPGVKASAATYIRKYNITEAREALNEVLACENCEMVKISAAMALVSVAGDEGLNLIKKAMVHEQNELVVAFYNTLLLAGPEPMSNPISAN